MPTSEAIVQEEAELRGRRQLALLWGASALALVVLSPFGALFAAQLGGCPFKDMTGYPCPGCGTTRAALRLAELDVLGALATYPLPALTWIFFVAGGLLAAGLTLLGHPPPSPPSRLPRWSIALLVLALLANWAWSLATGV